MKEIISELVPTKNKEKLINYARKLIELSNTIDIPDGPLGLPSPSSPILSCIIKENINYADIITHIRLLDINSLNLLNIMFGLKMSGINKILLVRGDPPSIGKKIDDISPEEGISIIRSNIDGIEGGLLLNLNKPSEEIEKRVNIKASFYLITRPWNSDKLERISKSIKRNGSKLYIYFVILSDSNKEFLLRYLPSEELIKVNKIKEAIDTIGSFVDGILFSSPNDFNSLLYSLEIANKVI
ncbi:MAG: hypothetical protein C0171_06985 [Caldisphaera sp.]|jgi:5,10-methylenetetrahydrofolate reductase|nr:MAG: hypothetical protein C0171_06985 [Caldisphaera sp.]